MRPERAAGDGVLRERLLTACREGCLSQKALTVLSEARDPYRLDTPAMHRAGAWVAEQMQRLRMRTPIHLRGLFYVLVSAGNVAKPGGRPFVNSTRTGRGCRTRRPRRPAGWGTFHGRRSATSATARR